MAPERASIRRVQRTGRIYLILQTNISGRIDVWLMSKQKNIFAHRTRMVTFHGADTLLAHVDALLSEERLPLRRIDVIGVVRGPGPFTAVRTGLLAANTLAWILKKRLIHIRSATTLNTQQLKKLVSMQPRLDPVRPAYGRSPNITRPKSLIRKLAGEARPRGGRVRARTAAK